MTILAVETATSLQSVAVVGEHGLCATETVTQTRHAATSKDHSYRWSIMPAIDRLLKRLRLTVSNLDGLAVSIGPGSFTGVRVGLATMQGLAHGTGRPLAAVPTLHALAMNVVGLGAPICALLDAKRGELVVSLFHDQDPLDLQPEFSALFPPQRVPVDQAAGWLQPHMHGNVIFVGDGVPLCRSILTGRFGTRALFAPEIACYPTAVSVAHLGKIRLAHGMLGGEKVTPIYLRPPDATPNPSHLGVRFDTPSGDVT